jgi:hypothetical protein
MAPVDFVNGGHADFYFGHRPSVSNVAYHFRELVDFGCLEDVAWRKRGASVATVYRGIARAEYGEDAWAELSNAERRDISRVYVQGLMVRIDGAFTAGTFHARADRQLRWRSMRVDERGWSEIRDLLADALAAVDQARENAEARLEELGAEGVTATAGAILFESPSLSGSPSTIPARTSADGQEGTPSSLLGTATPARRLLYPDG